MMARADDGTAFANDLSRPSTPDVAMRLGFPVDRWQAEPVSVKPLGRAERCRRWRATASSLGETFAGHTLRKTIDSALATPDAAQRLAKLGLVAAPLSPAELEALRQRESAMWGPVVKASGFTPAN